MNRLQSADRPSAREWSERDIWQNELVWWLCKAVLLLIEKELTNK